MSNTNRTLIKANKSKKDEFYTRLSDIEKEMRYYRDFFKDKIVLCNCDDPYESNFFRYFALNFNSLGLKKLISTCYATSPVIYTQLSLFGEEEIIGQEVNDEIMYASSREQYKKPYKAVLSHIEDLNHDGRIDLEDVALTLKQNPPEILEGDGDFRSDECIELLKEADVVVTNPPFSLFREYLSQLIQYNKKFIIIGNQNAITYKEVFPLVMNNRIWYGASIHSHGRDFMVPDDYPLGAYEFRVIDGKKYINVKGVRWITNIDYSQRHEDLILYKTYNPEEYPKYDNYDAIEVSKTADIPMDYDGVIGVPITFFDKYNPEQFDIIGATESEGKGFSNGIWLGGMPQPVVHGKRMYKRLFIKRR